MSLHSVDNFFTLLNNLKRHEGFMPHSYVCPAGAVSIGYGRNIDSDAGGLGITEEEADHLLKNDVGRSIAECQSFDWWGDTPVAKQMVIVELCFQLGWGRLNGFKNMLAAMSQQDYETASVELLDSRFADQVPNRANELAERLREEL